jgi:hypothetical protein
MLVTAYYTSQAPYSLIRSENDWKNYDYKKLTGKYTQQETDVETSIAYKSDKIIV